jgi:hypothetical protein
MKFLKSEVAFESPSKKDDHCKDCKHFLAHRRECQIVKGHIEPTDWCERFVAVSNLAKALRR